MKQKSIYKSLLGYIGRYKISVAASILLAIVTVVLTLYIPILTGQAVDEIIGKGRVDFSKIYPILIQIGISAGAVALSSYLMSLPPTSMQV